MAYKQFELDDGTAVSIYKRRGAKTIRLSVAADNTARVTIPFWLTYQAGLKFAASRKDWIKQHIKPLGVVTEGQQIGKYHRIRFAEHDGQIRTRITDTEVRVYHPDNVDSGDEIVQVAARRASLRALKAQANNLLPPRLAEHAKNHGFSYNKVTIKQMRGRWGSCDSNKNIVLNQYLVQLPWDLIDYVLLHELTHTNHMHHSTEFWSAMTDVLPNVKACKKAIKTHKPTLQVSS
jgi:predicted metal-dependent hydrolase